MGRDEAEISGGDLSYNCDHVWITNSGRGGEPRYKKHFKGSEPLMHVACDKCRSRTWFTRDQWESLPRADHSDTGEGDG